jgi:hypothetical protein
MGNDLGLEKYHLSEDEWRLLEDFAEILQVIYSILFIFNLILTST